MSGDMDRLLYRPPLLFLTIAALLPHLGWVCSGPQLTICKLALTLAFLFPTNSTATGTSLYSFITPACFCFFFRLFPQVHLWLTARSKVIIQHEKLTITKHYWLCLCTHNHTFCIQWNVIIFKKIYMNVAPIWYCSNNY